MDNILSGLRSVALPTEQPKVQVRQGISMKKADILDKCFDEIIIKKMQRGTPQIIEIADTRMGPNTNRFEKDYTDSVGGNLYVGNLHPKVSEEILFREFCKFGPIESLKIMHPRTEEERQRGRNCGFVKFKEREDAELAIDELEGILLFGYEVKLGWGKATSNQPGQVPITGYLTINSVSPNIVEISNALMMNPALPKIKVDPPGDESIRLIIDRVSHVVACVSIT